jgi:uncharacterized protein (TIGR03083 family)
MLLFPAPYSDHDLLIETVRGEQERFFNIIGDPGDWFADTRTDGWQVRDFVGHMIDETERYLDRWEMARRGECPKAVDLAEFREELRAAVLAHRELSREEAIARLREGAARTVTAFEALTEEEWSGLHVMHGFLGPQPASFFVPQELGHYALHAWDLGLGDRDAKLDERAAGILVPQYIFNLWLYMFDKQAAQHLHLKYGIKIDGDWGGSWIITVRDGEWYIAETDEISDVQAMVHYDHPSDMVLTSYLRLEAGRTSGDQAVIQMAKKLFNRPI